jgi:stage II sporulation SpoE-like protein
VSDAAKGRGLGKRRPFLSSTLASVLALVVIVPVFLVSSFTVSNELKAAYGLERQIYNTQALADQLGKLQSDEAINIRAYSDTGDRTYRDEYDLSVSVFPSTSGQLISNLTELKLNGAVVQVKQVVAFNQAWIKGVAEPATRGRPARTFPNDAAQGNKLIYQESQLLKTVDTALSDRADRAESDTNQGFYIATLFAVCATLLVGGGFVAFGAFGSRNEQRLEREQAIVEKFQQAFVSRWDALRGVSIGTAYVSATHEAEIGGDLFDVRRLDDERGYVLIADVSGKGIDAAVDTAFVKFTIRALALDGGLPGAILESFNRLVIGSLSNPDAFVVAFLGFFDSRAGTLRYASAGHAAGFLRRGSAVSALEVTGPILGLDPDDTFATETIALAPGDLVVLATDGLTEARDGSGRMLGEDGAMRWIADVKRTADPQSLADGLVTKLRAYVASRQLNDDLALLVLRVLKPGESDGVPTAQPAARASTRDA